ncbi:MAG: cytochrome P450 [Flavobacteriales bacterium]|jgi:cytochrome P450
MQQRQIPTVPFLRFIKNAKRILKNPLPFHQANFQEKGDTFRLKLGFGQTVVFSRNPGFAIHALQKNQRNYHKSDIQTKQLAKYVGQGLLTVEGDTWKTQRKLIQPAFHKKTLVNLLDKVLDAIQIELQRIETNAPIDIFPIFNDLAFQTVVKALFSSDIDPKLINRLQHITEAAQTMLVRELRQPFKKLYFKYGGPVKKHIAMVQEGREILRGLVHERRQSNIRHDDLLDMLLDARYEDGSGMDEEQLLDEILILFVAGHETTSNSLTFTMELLARHPEVQERLFREIENDPVMGEGLPSEADILTFIKSQTYAKQVIEESMRLYPPAYFIDRVNYEGDTFDGMEIPKGSNVLFSIIEIHKHKEYWEHPEAFDPDRFADNAGMKHPAYFPFGAGPRMCIGNNFAMYEMVLAVTEVVRRYTITSKSTPIEIKPLITLKPQNAILTFIPRT